MTKTGRPTNSKPNLQNIPVRTVEGQRIREAFMEPIRSNSDYSQIEARMMERKK